MGPPAAPVTPAEIDARGRVLAAQGRAAMEKNDLDQAVAIYNQLLNLPPNVASQEAQEMVGVARARQGDMARARAEFDLYLKLYPTGEGADRVRRELSQLAVAPPAVPGQREAAAPRPAVTTVTGSASQYYYGGSTLITTLTEGTPIGDVPRPPETTKISNVDQSRLATSIDLNYRRRDADSDMRFVVRDIYIYNFLDTQTPNQLAPNRLYALYGEYRSLLPSGFWARAGRQPATSAGMPGRFDGVRGGYRFSPMFGISAVAGVPSDDLYDTNQTFYGMSLDFDNIFDRVGASLYGIYQTVDGLTDRQAIGTELRYFDPTTSVYAVFDYDTLYQAMNIQSVQGTWQTFGNTVTFSLLADKRTAPMLATSNVLFAVPPPPPRTEIFRKVSDLLGLLSIDEIHQLVKATTTYVKQGLLSVNVQVSPKFQYGADVRMINIGALPAFKDIPAQPGTGNVYSYGLQGIFSNLYSERDANVFSIAYLDAPTYKGKVAAYNNLSMVWGGLQFEPSLRYYTQDDVGGAKTTRWSPGLRVSWQFANKWSIEGNLSVEASDSKSAPRSDGTTLSDSTTSYFYYLGYRYDF
jgi:tetratricopeptide (TPR) repeat protein